MTVLLVDNALALKSMRNSDFDAYSAFGEVVDNSIQANAKKIDIRVVYTPKSGKAFEPIQKIAFCDDGHGMEIDVLHRCLQLGYSSRYNDRSGIGRFGVGMTLGAINQCKRIDVYSRVKGGKWNWTYIDLDEIEAQHDNDEATGILAPVVVDLPKEFSSYAGLSSGTIVIWSKYDRQPDRASTMLDEMKIWFGRTFRFFIWDSGVELTLNGATVPAIDPLYARVEKTAFPSDPKAEVFPEIVLSWPVPIDDRVDGGPDKSNVRIRMSLLPEAFRPTQGTGGSKEAKERLIDRNEGLSIVRNNREVFFGEVPYWPIKNFFEEIDRWWGCEIHFDAVLDKAFTVKNIKRGAVPVRELKETICEQISPTRKSLLERVREVWAKAKAEDLKKEGGANGIDTGHSVAEKVAKKTVTPGNQIDKHKTLENEAQSLANQIGKDEDEQTKQRWAIKFKSQPFTIVDDSWKGATFLDVHHLGGKDVLLYNLQHSFFQIFKDLRQNIDQGIEIEKNAIHLKALVDLLLISYAKAEAMFEGNQQISVEDFVEQLKQNWGQYLQNYIKTWKAEEGL
jgi:hypothetical protein